MITDEATPEQLVIHHLTPTPLRSIELEAAESIIAGATVLQRGKNHDIGAMELSGELGDVVWYCPRNNLRNATTYTTTLDHCRIQAIVFDDNPERKVLSKNLLAQRLMTNEINRLLNIDEYALFPRDAEGLAEAKIAGYDALVYDHQVPGTADGGSSGRIKTANIRVYGISHGEGYTVISIVQEDDLDKARLDEIADMFIPVQR